jgi:hypothetical protein
MIKYINTFKIVLGSTRVILGGFPAYVINRVKDVSLRAHISIRSHFGSS